MAAQILDGKSLAASIRAALKERVAALVQRGVKPGLAVVLAGDDPASRVYVRNKRLAATETGVHSELIELPGTIGQRELRERIEGLNANRAIHGILVQLPLPKPIDAAAVLEAIAPAKDVDGFHEINMGALFAGRPAVVPCTPAGVMRLMEQARIPLADATPSSSGARTSSASPWRSSSCKRTQRSLSAIRSQAIFRNSHGAQTSSSRPSADRNSCAGTWSNPEPASSMSVSIASKTGNWPGTSISKR